MKNKNLILLLLIIAVASSALKAQEKEDYIPLLDTNKMWIEAMRMEFGDFLIYEYTINDTTMYHDTLFYELYLNESSSAHYLREDTIEKKVYYRQFFHYPEELLYDFSMEVGDSITFHGYTDYYWLLQTKQIETFFGKDRLVYYLQGTWTTDRPYVIWIEGVGSLAGILKSNANPSLSYMGATELNCYHYNNELLYHSDFASTYGCYFEIDPDPPYLDWAWTNPETVSLNEEVVVGVVAWDYSTITITATLTSPSGNEYLCSDFTYHEFEYFYAPFSDFNSETGDWYLSRLVLEDEQNNVTEENYTSENSPGKFTVTDIDNINTTKNSNILIYPTPATNKITVIAEKNNNLQYSIEIYDVFGKLVKQTNTSQTTIEVSEYKTGIYFIKIISNNKTIYTTKFIKQ